jgi:hypothetical protein
VGAELLVWLDTGGCVATVSVLLGMVVLGALSVGAVGCGWLVAPELVIVAAVCVGGLLVAAFDMLLDPAPIDCVVAGPLLVSCVMVGSASGCESPHAHRVRVAKALTARSDKSERKAG